MSLIIERIGIGEIAFFFIMARKRKRFDQLEAPPTEKKAANYKDPFQEKFSARLEEVGKQFEGKGRMALYILGALVLVALIAFFAFRWSNRTSGEAQAALGKAIDIASSRVTDQPQPPTATEKTFKTEKDRAEAAIAAFQAVADKFGGAIRDKALYFIAVNRLAVDRPAAIAELENIANSSSDNGKLAKFALAQTRAEDGKYDEAVALYQQLLEMSDPILAKESINFEIAKVYEKQGKTKEAADIYFNIAKAASEAKDADGKPIPMTQIAGDAKKKITELDPERAKEIQEPAPPSPFGG